MDNQLSKTPIRIDIDNCIKALAVSSHPMDLVLHNYMIETLKEFDRIFDLSVETILKAQQPPDPDYGSRLPDYLKIKQPDAEKDARVLISGVPVPEDGSHKELKENGQQKEYVVLSDEELAKGFTRPFRKEYTHIVCGQSTIMANKIAETYARDPTFYSGTFCCHCIGHFSLDQFVWKNTNETVGS